MFGLFGGSKSEERKSENVNWIQLTEINQLQEIKNDEVPSIIFKHSTRCSISSMALRNFENSFNIDDVKVYYLDLIAHRNISNEIADMFNVYHQSPQAIVLKNGRSIYDASHGDINVIDIKQALAK